MSESAKDAYVAQLDRAKRLDSLAGSTTALIAGAVAAVGFLGSKIESPVCQSCEMVRTLVLWLIAALTLASGIGCFLCFLYRKQYRWAPSVDSDSADVEFVKAAVHNEQTNKDRELLQKVAVFLAALSLVVAVCGTGLATLCPPKVPTGCENGDERAGVM